MPTIIDGSGSADFQTPLPIAEGGTGSSNGTASININGTVGATTAAAGSFTTVSATTNVSATAPLVSLQNTLGASASNQARTNYFVGNTFGGLENVAAIYATNPNAAANNGGEIVLATSTPGTATTPITRATISSTGLAVTGALSCTGALSKGSGSFRVDHPLPALTATRQLVHSFIEGPKADLIYRGKVALVDGLATVNIDTAATMTEGTFEVLCRDVQCFTTNESDWICVRGKVIGNILTIEAEDITATSVVSWMVIGERQDPHMMETEWTDENGRVIVEPLKPVPPQTLEEPT